MWVKGVGTVAIVLLGLFASISVKAQTSTTAYTVNGLQLGARVAPNSSAYHGYNCMPSGQFASLTWCSRSVAEKGSYGQKSVSQSLLRATDGTIVYANRATDLSSFKEEAAKKELQRVAQRYGAPRIIDMPRKPKSSQGMIASWGDVVLEPLDAASMSQLALGKSPNKGLIIDFLGNFRRSAQLGLPVYRMTGGAGFVWAASFNQKGAGALRFAAVNPSALSAPVSTQPPVAAEPAAQPTETQAQAQPEVQAQPEAQPAKQAEPEAQATPQVQSQAPPAQPQPQMQSQAPAQPQAQPQAAAPEPTPAAPVAQEAEPDTKLVELNQTVDKLKSQLASYASDVIQLEKEKAQALQALPQLHQALNDADTARQQAQAAALTLKGQLDAAIRRSNNLAYAMLAGLVVVLLTYGAVFAGKWRQLWLARREPSEKIVKVPQQPAPATVNAAGLLSELEQHVANINAEPGASPAVVPDQAPTTVPEETPAVSRAEAPAVS